VKEVGELSPEPPAERDDAWVKNTSKRGNMSLMTVEKRYGAAYSYLTLATTSNPSRLDLNDVRPRFPLRYRF
jgi:hypothetical protein